MKSIKAAASGRVNLIGEHTDYNDGWVLPTAIPQKTSVELTPRQDDVVIATSTNFDEAHGRSSTYILGKETPTNTWIDYLQGVTAILAQTGNELCGFNIHVDSNIPVGSGLSSSAALEISVLKAIREACNLKLSDIEIAQIGRRAENEFVGAKVGIMDQMACALAKHGEALFLDTKTLAYQHIPLNLKKMDLLVINSGVAHQHAGGDYNQRRAECEEACRLLRIDSLRQIDMNDLSRLDSLPTSLKKRARHVITENARVHKAVEAIERDDLFELGRLFYESHASMAMDYEVSIREIDLLVELCRRQTYVYGARLTGGGFGGSIVAITEPGMSHEVAEKVCEAYARQTNSTATILVAGNKKQEELSL